MQHSFQLVILQVIYHTAIIYSRNNICTHDTLFYSCLFLACLLVCCASQLIIEHTELTHTHTHTHPFNGPLSGTTRVGWYQKGNTNLDFTEARDNEWQWHQLGHMQVCTSLQTDNQASTPPLCFYRPDALPATQPTASKH